MSHASARTLYIGVDLDVSATGDTPVGKLHLYYNL